MQVREHHGSELSEEEESEWDEDEGDEGDYDEDLLEGEDPRTNPGKGKGERGVWCVVCAV